MQLTASQRAVSAAKSSAAPCRAVTVAPTWRRRVLKPVCFKENRPDSIDEVAAPAPTAVGMPYLQDPGVQPVHLGTAANAALTVLKYGTLAAAVAAIAAPGPVGSFLFSGAALGRTDMVILSGTGASLLPTWIAKHVIKRTEEKGTLASGTTQRLMGASLLHGLLSLAVLAQAGSLHNPVLLGTVGLLPALATATCAYALAKVHESGQLVHGLGGMVGAVRGLFTPANTNAAWYGVLAVAMTALGVGMMASNPLAATWITPETSIGTFASRMTGASVITSGLILLALKSAADLGLSGGRGWRAINLSMAGWSAAAAAIQGFAVWAGIAQAVAATWAYLGLMAATAAFCGYNWATSATDAA